MENEKTEEAGPKMKRRKQNIKLTPKYYRSIIRKEMKMHKLSVEASTSIKSFTSTSDILPNQTTLISASSLEYVTPIEPSPSSSEILTERTPYFESVESIDTSPSMSDILHNQTVPLVAQSLTTLTSDEPLVGHISKKPCTPNLAQKLKQWAVGNHVTHCVFNNLLNILKNVTRIEELTNLPSNCRTLLKTKRNNDIVDMGSGHYYHFGLLFGLKYALQNQIVPNDEVIYFDINIDGLPLTKSSGSQFWPILGGLCVGGDPFIIGVWHGTKKPKHCNEVLETFINEYTNLKKEGFYYENQKRDISLSKIICDAPAKSFILCTKGHNSYFGCTKCITEGTYLNNRVCYTDLNSPLRTDSDFRLGKYGDDYHTYSTPLLKLEIDLIKNVPLDYMHLVCLGVVKRLIQFWLRGNMAIRMKAVDSDIVEQMILNVRNCISYHDFARLPRPLHDFDRWKATEFRQFLLYTGPILLKDRLKPSQYMHFLSLTCAIRILCNNTLCLKYANYAKELLVYFVRIYSRIYGKEYVSHNVHNLIHLPDDVLNFGTLDNFSAFKYENHMHEIKKCLKTCRMPLQQFINRVNEQRSFLVKNNNTTNKNNTVFNYITTYKEPLLNSSLVKVYKWVRLLHFKLGTDVKNNHCLLKGNVIIKINKIIQCLETDNIFIIYQRYLLYENSFNEPCDSKIIYGGTLKNLSHLNEIIAVDEVVTKCIHYEGNVVNFVV